jgi:hypothetical protein
VGAVMKIEITNNLQDNTYTAKIWDGPDGIDYADFLCGSLGECFEEIIKWEVLNGVGYVND